MVELPRAGIINSGEIMKQTAPAVNKTSMMYNISVMTYNISVLYAYTAHMHAHGFFT